MNKTGVSALRLPPEVVAPLRTALAEVAGHAVAAITAEVPAYREAFAGEMGEKIERAVRGALGTFLNLLSRDMGAPLEPALEAAYALGRGEARYGRSLDALLAAYRVGARVAWRDMATTSVAAGVDAITIMEFAELVFAYIDELSAASVAGHADELASAVRARRRNLERLGQALIAAEPAHALVAAAELAEWPPPVTLTAVLLPARAIGAVVDLLDARTLQVDADDEQSVLLVPDAHGAGRGHLMRLLAGREAVIGPPRAWERASESHDRAVRARSLGLAGDTEEHLVTLLLGADPGALADLRARVLAPLADEGESSTAKLTETLRSWLRHQGRRDEIAAELFVHPQTVRYRVTRLRELYGDRLRDPDWLVMLTVALAT
ncbi:PucR family transcriptional regulator [Catenuloplanes japonicus]|uniref:PucR family transcriptional regulator n=1 Tax=Catenuloplanes japonicus TaxID=33876 RepID=UPI000AAEA837|nr:PucR family transcriptional regulator [Catenuloplanes japonicus]